ncbi:hypothetical protein Sya03_57910 [Spirilliplanes yamanashiensis]|uniref:ABC3 transporter permease C-terminal domain-containing protein n=2 Tax=Spirilliplanes yamanashiensis TaxID=42233 RepID=A0A8J3YE75_9ACTN|nr:hypothetical protein Sya03_57910 [Spirilliplanes yamanashiensis]
MLRLAYAGTRTDRLRAALTALSAALAAVALLAAATVAAIRPGAPGTWPEPYTNALLNEAGLRPGVITALILLGLPVLALAGQCIRLGAPARDRRLAAVRLAGATPRQAVWIAAAETGLAALAGTVAGLAAFLVLRATLDRRDPSGQRYLPTDVLPSPVAVAAVVLAVPLAAALIGALLLRRVIITPLGVTRRVRDRAPRAWTGAPIVLGVLIVALIPVYRDDPPLPVPRNAGYTLAILGVLLVTLGIVFGTGWIAWTAGRLLVRYGRRPAALLAGRRLMADPWSGSRTLAALLAAVVFGAVALGVRQYFVTEIAAMDEANRLAGATDGSGISLGGDTSFYLNAFALVNVAVGIGLILAAAGLLVAMTEGIVARRRTEAALLAAGVPRRTIAGALAWQALTPFVPAVLVALTVGTSLPRTVLGTEVTTGRAGTCSGTDAQCADESSPFWTWTPQVVRDIPVPLPELTLLGGGTLALMLLALVAGLALMRSATSVEELRAG